MDDDLPKISLRGGFSDRNHIKQENTKIQYKEFDERTRKAIVNLSNRLFEIRSGEPYHGGDFQDYLVRTFFTNVYNTIVPVNGSYDAEGFLIHFYDRTILEDDYDAVLTVVEYFADHVGGEYGFLNNGEPLKAKFTDLPGVIIPQEWFNDLFEKEFVGYRFVNKKITPITNEREIEAIDSAVQSPYKDVDEHLDKALIFLSDREHPDYPNSIKESITAVETLAVIFTGADRGQATLGKMLGKLETQGLQIHPALKEAFNKLYGYASDGKAIRHTGNLDGPDATFEEAKYMLVSCSAFVNYLIGVSSKVGSNGEE